MQSIQDYLHIKLEVIDIKFYLKYDIYVMYM